MNKLESFLLVLVPAFFSLVLFFSEKISKPPLFAVLVIICAVTFYAIYQFYVFYKDDTALSSYLKYLISCYSLIILFAIMFRYFGMKLDGKIIHSTFEATYLSVITWTSVGYGDVVPVSHSRLVAMIEALISYVMMGLLVAKIILHIQRLDAKQR